MLAVAARSPADERSLMRGADDVTTIELRVAESAVGKLRMRARDRDPDPSLLRLLSTLIASEVERVRAPERASEEAASSFLREVLDNRIRDRGDLLARGQELGTDLAAGRRGARRPRPSPQPDRGRLAPAAAGAHRPRCAGRGARGDRGARRRTADR